VGVQQDAVGHLSALWDDGGAAVLARAGLASWAALAAALPDALLVVPADAESPGRVILGRLRDLFLQANQLAIAEVLALALCESQELALGSRHPDTLVSRGRLGSILARAGKPEQAAVHLEVAGRGLRDVLDGPDLRLAVVATELGRLRRGAGDLVTAETLLRTAYEIRQVVTPDRLGLAAAQLAEVMVEAGKDEAGAQLLQTSWELLVRERGEHDRVTVDRARSLGPLWLRLDQPARAAPVLRSLWAWTRVHGDEEDRAEVQFALGRALDATGAREEGLRLVEQAVRWTRTWLDDEDRPHLDLPQRLSIWARMTEERSRPDEAEGYLLEAVEAERLLHGPDSPEVGLRQAAVGDLCYRMRRLDDAIGWMDAGLGLLRSSLGDRHDLSRLVAERLIDYLLEKADDCMDVLRDRALGWQYIERARAICRDVLGPDHPSHRTLKYYRSA
jgi:tetratricopeptide (TPR) repeat protein